MVLIRFADIVGVVKAISSVYNEPIENIITDYAVSIVSAHGQSVTLEVISNEAYWTKELESKIRLALETKKDESTGVFRTLIVKYLQF